MRRFALAFALLALALPGLSQQPQTFEEQIDVNAVLLDVIVTDNRGNQILGLSKDDFIVKENGVQQEVDSVDYFTNRRLLDAREESAPFKVERVREDRYFVFFFDKPEAGALFEQLALARQGVRDFLDNHMKETDLVAVVGHDVRLKVYSDFTADKNQLRRALEESTRFGKGLDKAAAGEGPSILRNVDLDTMTNRTGTVYQALDVLADSLRSIRARKNLILFSPGIADIHESVRGGMLFDRSRYLDPAIESLNAANVSVYAAQLQSPSNPNMATTPFFHQRLTEIADATGGRYFQFNTTFKPAIEKVEETNAGYYLVTYRSKHPKGEKGFQKVDVSLKNPEFRITARSGYEYGG
jgi:VWFA-related protein